MGTKRRHHKRRYYGGEPLSKAELKSRMEALEAKNPKLTYEQRVKQVHDDFVKERLRGPAFDESAQGPAVNKRQAVSAAMRAAKAGPKAPEKPEESERAKLEKEHYAKQAEEERDIETTRESDEKARRNECRAYLKNHTPPLKTPEAAKTWLEDKSNRRANPQDYAEVRDCVRALTAPKEGAGKTRRRKSRHRR